MVAPNSTFDSQSPFTLLSGPGLPIRRVSNASIDKLVAASEAKKSNTNKRSPLKAVKKGATKAKVKAVRFSEATKVITRDVVKGNDASNKNNNNIEDVATWYQPQDYAHIKYEILSSIDAITKVFKHQNTTPLDLNQHCLRGIETSISTDLYQRRKHRIRSTTKNVMEHQRLQRLVGVSDPLALRAISLKCSQDAQESAISVGKLDAQL